MLTATSKHAATILDTDSAGKVLREGVAAALAAPGGPSSIEWPIDLQYAEHVIDVVEPVSESPRTPDVDELAVAFALLQSAKRPVIWAGGGVATAGAELTELVEQWGVPLLTSNSGRGAVPEDHPLCIGNYGNTPAGLGSSGTPTCCCRWAPTSGPTRPATTPCPSPPCTCR